MRRKATPVIPFFTTAARAKTALLVVVPKSNPAMMIIGAQAFGGSRPVAVEVSF